jgi:transketolase
MRKRFTELLYKAIKKDSNLHFLTADLGFKMWDNIEKDYPFNFTKLGSSEQLMMGMAVGLSYSNKIPICYSISTFLLNRPFEWLRNFVNYENLPVKLVGSGRDYDYSHDGWTHWPCDDEKILKPFENFTVYKPETIQELEEIFNEYLYSSNPCYLNLKRT